MSLKPATLVILMGLPGSGKSTFAKVLQENLSGHCVLQIEYDQLIPLELQKQLASEIDARCAKLGCQTILQHGLRKHGFHGFLGNCQN